MLSEHEKCLIDLLREALTGEINAKTEEEECRVDPDLIRIAELHKVTPILYDRVARMTAADAEMHRLLSAITDRTVQQSYHLLLETMRMVCLFEKEEIRVIVLKGAAAASFYPIPEYRKAGDIDLLLTKAENLDKAVFVAKKNGYRVSEAQHALHHVVMENPKGMMLELHTAIAEPFDNTRINDYMDRLLPDIGQHIVYKEIMGFLLPILDDDYQAYELLLHMLQHFLREGFGLKLLCDWVLYWNDFVRRNDRKAAERYRELVRESRINGFSNMISAVCRHFLGMNEEAYRIVIGGNEDGTDEISREDAMEFLREVLDGGEFGKNEKGRMVVLRDAGVFSYVREFHHQMHLNFPEAGKIFLIWPLLWMITLLRFMKNNRKLRNVSEREIFHKARARSGLMKKMNLWR